MMSDLVPREWPEWSGSRPDLRAGEMHVWRFSLDADSSVIEHLSNSLSPDEIERAERFLFDDIRRRFIVCRAAQRAILAAYLGELPHQLRFQYENLGKPSLSAMTGDPPILFNLANSKSLGLLGVTQGVELGIDVEKIRAVQRLEGLAQRFFADIEIRQLESIGEEDREQAFFRIWTRKEALLKAVGKGLTFPLDQVIVSLLEAEPCRVVHFGDDDPSTWWLAHLAPQSGYFGAVACRTEPRQIRTWTLRADLL
jgi:4'-phosphopantetheinyl transferase